ncbi:P-loop containing nucleoside triphosphate hydrolase protein [Calocera cornea HHB12733]|uniref:RNA helicase n=1 Tax=Calocera cornea HHB12733 TaxID=1353952 RepID=A0A165EIJ1_9BASI|nr:P-loop containing nucleoside triphosphate hydrolase protein [Calocera cornea HHB12733]
MTDLHPEASSSSGETFSSLTPPLDPRLLRALAALSFLRPTPIQSRAIPLALSGRDILARARTGSGKTAAYCLPLVQRVLAAQRAAGAAQEGHVTRGLVLVPTRELAEQVNKFLEGVLQFCQGDVVVANIAAGTHLSKTLLTETPDIVISTPSKALSALSSHFLTFASLEALVIDEADLILSYGHDADVRRLLAGEYLPRGVQAFLMSATMTRDVEQLRGLVLRNPAVLTLEDTDDAASTLTQYAVWCSEEDKFLLLYVILKLRLVRGKCIIFVNSTDRCYRLKLFLEQFSIRACVLNAELPLNSRFHIVQEFNSGVYEYVVATDESGAVEEGDDEEEETAEQGVTVEEEVTEELSTQREEGVAPVADDEAPAENNTTEKTLKRKRDADSAAPAPKKKRKSKARTDKEYGVSRGIDFVDVSCVINFDLPTTARAYTHRIGRTARAGKTGLAISFVVPLAQWGKNRVVSLEGAKEDEAVFGRIEREQSNRGGVKEWKFEQKQVDAFRYRAGDAMRAVTRAAVREARVKEVKEEILKSEKLKAHFEDNPLDLAYLRHDKPLHPQRIQAHMKHIPSYLVPRIAAVDTSVGSEEMPRDKLGFVPFTKDGGRGRGRGRGRGGRGGRGGARGGGRKKDPLKTFRS